MTNKLKLISYCGLYCPKCYNMKISQSAKKLWNELKSAEEKGSKILLNDPSINKVLNNLMDLECIEFCREGSKKTKNCKIKICCIKNNITGCWECNDLNSCKKLKKEFFYNNLKIKEIGIEKYIKNYK